MLDELLRQNKAICEAKEPIAVREVLLSHTPAGHVESSHSAKAEKVGDKTIYSAKISHADKVNQNRRIYSRALWERVIKQIKPKIAEGKVKGSVDHLGQVEGGNLERSPVIWRDMEIAGDGSVIGKYEIVEGHTAGANLKALRDAGSTLGWSTFGYGDGHEPTPDECMKYGIPEDSGYVVMNEDSYGLVKVDCVDDPSCIDAWDLPDSPSRMAQGDGRNRKTEKVVPPVGSLNAKELSARIKESKSVPPPPTNTQYQASKNGDTFSATGDVALAKTLDNHAYRVVDTYYGPVFTKMRPATDDLLRYANPTAEKVLAEIDNFWGLKEQYAKLGMKHSRGIMMYGPPGTGKTSVMHQTAESIVDRGDVVFYPESIWGLIDALKEFREVEPDRQVVVCLEDTDGFLYPGSEKALTDLLDGNNSVSGVLYLASTNYIERFPERMLRPGRFDKKVYVGPPSYDGRLAYLTKKLESTEQSKEEIERLAKESDGLSFGHLRELIAAIYILKEPANEVIARLKGAKSSSLAANESHSRLCNVPEDNSHSSGETKKVTTMKTLAELKAAHPELFAQHEKAVADSVKSETARLKPIIEAFNALAGNAEFRAIEGVALPEKQVLPEDVKAQLEKADADKSELAKQIESAKTITTELQKKLDAIEAEKAEAKRLSDVKAELAKLVKDNANAELISEDVLEAAVAKDFTAEKVKALVEAKSARYSKLVKSTERPAKGVDVQEDIDELDEPTGESRDNDYADIKPAPVKL